MLPAAVGYFFSRCWPEFWGKDQMLLKKDSGGTTIICRSFRERLGGAGVDCVNQGRSVNGAPFTSRKPSRLALCGMQQELAAENPTYSQKVVTRLPRRSLPSTKIAGDCLRQARPDIRYHRPLANDTDRERRVLRLLSSRSYSKLQTFLSVRQLTPILIPSVNLLRWIRPPHPPGLMRRRTEPGSL